ncbi:MAG: GNAT family N-acetyltransferase [Armatimonadetes bacterium]|nr:GNAT family N-acetyltransferase [Armatimonadota bacterium]
MTEVGEIRIPHGKPFGPVGSLTLRSRREEDDPRLVEIYSLREGDSLPLTVERYRAEHAGKEPDRRGEVWVVEMGGRPAGFGRFSPAWWTGQPDIYSVEIRIDPAYGRRGIGTRLFDQLRSRLLELGATRLVSWVRADAGDGLRFAARHGFVETGEVIQEYRLSLREAKRGDAGRLEERLRHEGVRITSLAEAGGGEAFLRDLQHVWADSGEEPPDPQSLRHSFPSWRREVLDGPGLSPETHWVALDGDRPVGMTFLRRLSSDAAENDYTGVAASHRGRGIAPALKWKAIEWARQHGLNKFHTSSEVGNARMIAINRRLGYQSGPQRREVARDLS